MGEAGEAAVAARASVAAETSATATATAWPGEQLVRAAQDGDAEAVRALVSGSYPHVLRFAKTLCATPQDAEDAAQEALIILYSRIGMLRATAALGSWMFRIVRNECLRRARMFSRTAARVSSWDAAAVCPPVEDDVLARLEAEAVVAAIVALPGDLRRVLILRDVQGCSGRAVAEELGLSVAAMKSRLHRARATVRAALLAGESASASPSEGRDALLTGKSPSPSEGREARHGC